MRWRTENGWSEDAWPDIWKKVAAAEILIIGTPIWLGEESSVCRLMIERLYAMSAILNDKGQSSFYGKVGGAVITGNEDGSKHCCDVDPLRARASRLHHSPAGR